MIKKDIRKLISLAPDAPGVYLMKDDRGQIIYIGKARSLMRRLSSYAVRRLSDKALSLMDKVTDIEYRLCQSEAIALLLEAGLIHKHKPRYNVSLRDDKSFPFVKITDEEFPAVYITRKKEKDSSMYFGPYTNAALLKSALKIIRRSFPYRSCKKLPKKACIYYRIKLSAGACIGKITKKRYAGIIRQICLILKGKDEALIKELSVKMRLKAKRQRFEEAAELRDKIIALSSLNPQGFLEEDVLRQLKNILKLKDIPRRIEAFDVSNIFGKHAGAAMVSFYNGLPDKGNYRRFRIKSAETADDYRMLAEALRRRYNRLKQENSPMPDLILADGGKGQLSAAKSELSSLNLDIPVISLAKRQEEIYTQYSLNPIRLKYNCAVLRFLQRIRDESHRFALKYHRNLRKRNMYAP